MSSHQAFSQRGRVRLAATAALIASVAAVPRASAGEPGAAPPAPEVRPSSAEAPAANALRSVTLDAALALARAQHPAIQAARARVTAARADAEIPRSQWLPSVGAVAEIVASTVNNSTTTVVSSPLLDLPRIGATPLVSGAESSLVPYPSTLVALGVRQTVLDFGRIAAESAAFDRLVEVEGHRADGTRLDVGYRVTQAYYAVLAARAVVRTAEEALERARAHRDQAQAMVSSGMRSPIELTRAEADVARFELERLRAEGDLAITRGTFAAAVGVKETELDAEEPKKSAPLAAEPGAAKAPSPLPSLQIALERSEANEPLLKEAASRVEAQRAATSAISAQLRPRLFATASISGRGGGAQPSGGSPAELGGWVPEVPNWSVGLVLSWPVFDATVDARTRAARAREDAARAELLAARQLIRDRTQQVYKEAAITESTLAALRQALEAARANYAQAEARFNAGFGSSLELSDAERLRTQAEIDLAIGTFEQSRSRAALSRATVEGGVK